MTVAYGQGKKESQNGRNFKSVYGYTQKTQKAELDVEKIASGENAIV